MKTYPSLIQAFFAYLMDLKHVFWPEIYQVIHVAGKEYIKIYMNERI